MQPLKAAHPDLVILVVDPNEPASLVKSYYEGKGVTFPVAVDEASEVRRLYHVYSYPTNIFLDRQGVIRQRSIGYSGADGLKSALQLIVTPRP